MVQQWVLFLFETSIENYKGYYTRSYTLNTTHSQLKNQGNRIKIKSISTIKEKFIIIKLEENPLAINISFQI